jgi:hypothetical protein
VSIKYSPRISIRDMIVELNCADIPPNLQLEELDDIFHTKNPRKASLEKKKITLDKDANNIKTEAVT